MVSKIEVFFLYVLKGRKHDAFTTSGMNSKQPNKRMVQFRNVKGLWLIFTSEQLNSENILREVGFHKLTHLVQSFPRLFSVPESSAEHAVLNLHNGDVHTFYVQNEIVGVHLINGGHDRKKRKAPDFDHLGRAPHSREQSSGEGHTAFQYPGFSFFAHQSFQIRIVRFNKQAGPVEVFFKIQTVRICLSVVSACFNEETVSLVVQQFVNDHRLLLLRIVDSNDQSAVSSNVCGCGQLGADLGYRNRQ
ncbi:hypothetical protein T03_15370 [Trichinella britovi]|uniref:Uncharacterized protein n=1 Tax=Trichinella britovi TaxID=45882 RepID=A0A0V1CNF6_TRIBR|nr:hypothetical protein T03_15370 [Trichinella britovi]